MLLPSALAVNGAVFMTSTAMRRAMATQRTHLGDDKKRRRFRTVFGCRESKGSTAPESCEDHPYSAMKALTTRVQRCADTASLEA